jgi:hypothetical protein
LGHIYIAVTLNTYTHVLPDKRAEVAKKIEEAIVYPVGIRLASKGPGECPALPLLRMFYLQIATLLESRRADSNR